MFSYKKLTAIERISKCRIALMDSNPFWARLCLSMDIVEDKGELPECGGMGVDARGRLLFKEDFLENYNDGELQFILAHEVSHLMFHHLTRIGKRDHMKWNIVCDLAINTILSNNNFVKPSDGVFCNHNNEFEIGGIVIKDVDKKSAEQLYDEFPEIPEDMKRSGGGYKGQFDEHLFGKMSEVEKKKIEENWNDQIIEAATIAKMRGNSPLGMERLIGSILNPKVNWKTLLYRYITNSLPFDFSFMRPSKKSISTGFYMPSVQKEVLEVVCAVDTSGSISQKELSEFLSEMVSISKSFGNVRMTILQCDAEIQDVMECTNGNISTILDMKAKGGGGTSHKPVFEWVGENKPNCKLLVCLTDGFSDQNSCDVPGYSVVWAVTKGGCLEFDFGQIVEMED